MAEYVLSAVCDEEDLRTDYAYVRKNYDNAPYVKGLDLTLMQPAESVFTFHLVVAVLNH